MKFIDRLLAAFGLARSSEAVRCNAGLDSLEEAFTRRADNARAAKYEEDQSKWWAIGVEFAFREAACAVRARRAEIAKESNVPAVRPASEGVRMWTTAPEGGGEREAKL